MKRLAAALVLGIGCGSPPAQRAPEPPVAPVEPTPPDAATVAPRMDFEVGESPMSVVVSGAHMVWTDGAGAIWTMQSEGGTPKQLSEQHDAGFMFHPVVVGDQVFVSTKRDVVRVALPDGPVTKLGLALADDPEQVVGDDRGIYVTLFKRDDVLAIPVGGGRAQKLATFRRGVLATHGGTLYAVSYSSGTLASLGATDARGGAAKTIAKGFVRPTALAVDATHAFVYTERDKILWKVDLATGERQILAQDLENSDDLVSDGAYVYTFSWPSKLLRIAKDGSRAPVVLADDLKSPHHIAVTGDAIYVTSRDQNKIVRLAK